MSTPFNPELLAHFQQTNPAFMEQYAQQAQAQSAAVPTTPPAPQAPATPQQPVARRQLRPRFSGGNLVHSRPFQHLGRRKK